MLSPFKCLEWIKLAGETKTWWGDHLEQKMFYAPLHPTLQTIQVADMTWTRSEEDGSRWVSHRTIRLD
ncbi:hypothetical protein BOTBODRAFT_38319 [Botryobasidium botryosum FD-172 SS1]|uniref:Uncharacterized protein n=1 Tax=Botryobasidium botryosum (strain FD-172 SS1) TaxID=930990 RepID=A0A067LXP9_BOTB1|nr:hypothetical protein BOTBODRAFT_38319 [Botryobasidium botryosum FD-172 SS1]